MNNTQLILLCLNQSISQSISYLVANCIAFKCVQLCSFVHPVPAALFDAIINKIKSSLLTCRETPSILSLYKCFLCCCLMCSVSWIIVWIMLDFGRPFQTSYKSLLLHCYCLQISFYSGDYKKLTSCDPGSLSISSSHIACYLLILHGWHHEHNIVELILLS